MDADGASDDGHHVLSECAGLVGTDDGRVRHCFTRAEDTDEKVLLGHAFCRERECESDSKGKAYI